MLKELRNGFFSIPKGEWSKDPRAIITAGSREKAQKYEATLARKGIKEAYLGVDTQTDLPDRGRLGFVGGDDFGYDGFGGSYYLDVGRVFGVAPEALRAKNFGSKIPLEDRVEVLTEGRIRFKGKVYRTTE